MLGLIIEMKTLFFLLFFVGWTMVITGYARSYARCPPNEVEYRYISRNLMDEQLAKDNKGVSSMFDEMVAYRDPLT